MGEVTEKMGARPGRREKSPERMVCCPAAVAEKTGGLESKRRIDSWTGG